MAIKYRLYQDNRAESTTRGKWYARAIYPKTPKCTKDLAQMIQDNVSVKKSDVIAVLDELVNVMKLWLQESYRVKLDGFGSFKIGLATKPADTAKDFSASKHVVGSRVNFQPETHWSSASGGQRRRVFLDDLQVEETPVNAVDKDGEQQSNP
ncbi:MAG: HU family DNA-binding protein [Prevotella sp.]|nr:HU family DNA-binding protein [Prevotella sp.]